jgi:two-component system cell cycle sensor histidine kinase/response regulator CckA
MQPATTPMLRVLLVDDDEDDCALTRDLVSQIRAPRRAELEWASSYDAGLAALRNNGVDVCLLDYRLGARDGLQLLSEARSDGCICPIIVLTGKGGDGTDILAMTRGADDFMVKGDLSVALLERSIRYAIERARHVHDLRASEQRYRSIFEKSSDGILIAEVETGAIRYSNPAASRIFGHDEAALCAMNVDALSADPNADTGRTLASLAQGTKRLSLDEPHLRQDGTVILTDVSATTITVGDRTMVVGFFRDVTERAQAAGALRASESRYRRLFEAAKDGILILDADSGRIVDVNPYMTELTGYVRDDFMGKHIWEIGPFRDTAASMHSFAELQAREYVRYDDLPLRTIHGRNVDVEFVSNVYLVNGDKVIQCNIRDITKRKRVEAALLMQDRAVQAVLLGILISDAKQADNPIVYASPGFTRLTGYAHDEIVGKNCRLLQGPDTDPTSVVAIRDAIREQRSCVVELLNYRKDGTSFWNSLAMSPVRDDGGRVTNFVGVQTDVTSRRLLEAQFLQAQKMEAVGRLAGGVAHDFNNLLSVILCYADLLAASLSAEEPMHADVEEIRVAALRASDLTRQLLAFSRQQVLEPKVLNLNDVLGGMSKMLGRLLGADIELTIVPASRLGSVKADAGQLEQIVMNLAVNARDAMVTGGRLTVETADVDLDDAYAKTHHGVSPGPYVALAVSDTGTGMDRETMARVFEPFFTTKGQGKGTGLGLATVFGIVKQSGGHIFVESELNKGTAFKIYLPRVGALAEPHSVAPSSPDTERRGGTILLVEDESQVRSVASTILRRQGYVVLEASNGGEAFLICEQHPADIDLLLTDVVLPRMSGRHVAERLGPLRPAMRVLYMSGYTDDAALHGIVDSGVPFLQKPFTPASLTRKVRDVLHDVGHN